MGEGQYEHQREVITRVFGKPLHERYGGRDIGVIGIQVDPARSLAFWVDWSNVLVEPEVAPRDGEPASVLITKLHADGMPMLRYRVGDEARFPAGSRPGHPALSLDEVVGREADRISLPSGGWVHGLEFPHMLKDFPVRDYRVHQRADASVTVSVVALDAFSPAHRERLLELLRANMPGLPVAVELVDAIPKTRANKWRPVVSEIGGSATPSGGARS